jgi:hypothetical protein
MPYIKASELRELEDVLRHATLNTSSFGHIGTMADGADFPVDEREVDAFIRERTRIYRRSWILSPLLRVINTLRIRDRQDAIEMPELIPDRERRARKDKRAWDVSTRVADDPEANADHTYRLDELKALRSNPVFRLAATMQPGDKLTYVSEDALTTFAVRCWQYTGEESTTEEEG